MVPKRQRLPKLPPISPLPKQIPIIRKVVPASQLQPVAKPVRTAANEKEDALELLDGILEYTEGKRGRRLIALYAVTRNYALARANNNKGSNEYWFPLVPERTRKGYMLRVQSVLKREGEGTVEWDKKGQPVRNLILVDDMMEGDPVHTWRIGLMWNDIQLILTEPRPALIPKK